MKPIVVVVAVLVVALLSADRLHAADSLKSLCLAANPCRHVLDFGAKVDPSHAKCAVAATNDEAGLICEQFTITDQAENECTDFFRCLSLSGKWDVYHAGICNRCDNVTHFCRTIIANQASKQE